MDQIVCSEDTITTPKNTQAFTVNDCIGVLKRLQQLSNIELDSNKKRKPRHTLLDTIESVMIYGK